MLAITDARTKNQGFTVIEILVVLTLLATIAALAAPSFQQSIARQKLSVAASDLMTSALQARSEAIKTNQQTIVQPVTGADWAQGWRIYVDMDKDKTYSAGDTLITTVDAVANGVTVHEAVFATAADNLIAFDPSGFLVGRNAGRVVFKSSTVPTTELLKGIKVSVVGRARVCTTTPASAGCAAAAD